jgi:hypothetical protein
MNSVLSTNPFPAVVGTTSQTQADQTGSTASRGPVTPARISRTAIPAEMPKLMNRKVLQQGGICAICHEEFSDYNDIVPDHKIPKGMDGAWRDDNLDNVQATHWWCNDERIYKNGMTYGRLSVLSRSRLATMPVNQQLAHETGPWRRV